MGERICGEHVLGQQLLGCQAALTVGPGVTLQLTAGPSPTATALRPLKSS